MASTRRLVSRARTWSFGACAVSIVPLAGVHAQLAGARGNRGSGSEGIASVHELALSPDGERVVYLYNDPDVSLQFRLFSAPVDDSQPPVELEPPLAPGENVRFFRISPDSHSVVFSIDRPTNRVREWIANDFADILPLTTASGMPCRRATSMKFGQTSDSTMITSRGLSRLR